jgi:hypothetical protein
MHAPNPWIAPSRNTRQGQLPTGRSTIVTWLTERRSLEIFDALVLGLLLLPFVLA